MALRSSITLRDDGKIDHVNGPRIIGPVSPEDQETCERTIAFCEVPFMHNEFGERSDVKHNGEPLDEPDSAFLIFHLLQRSLPQRLQMPIAVATVQMGRQETWLSRKLLKELHMAWRKPGGTMPRGTASSNLEAARKRIESVYSQLFDTIQSKIYFF